MKTFITVLKNDFLRTVPRLGSVLVMTLITLASILLAVYVTGVQQVKGHIAFVAQSGVQAPASTPSLEITVLSAAPPRSDLVKQKYDAVVTVDAQGAYSVETLRSEEIKNSILLLLQNPGADVSNSETDRGTGVNIIGFMMMFLLMISFSNLFAFADDKEQGQLKRIAASPASFGFYLTAHCVYCLAMILPAFLLLALLKGFGWNLGFSLAQYALLLAVLGFLGIASALLLHTLFKKPDNANMLGNAVMVLTSILAGSFYSFSRKNAVLDNIIRLIPQKDLMNFAQSLQNGTYGQHLDSLLYVVAFSFVLFTSSCIILYRMYVKKV